MNDDMNYDIDEDEDEVEILVYNSDNENQVESNYIDTNSNNINNKNIKYIKIGIALLSIFIIVVASIGYFKKSNNLLIENDKYELNNYDASDKEYKLLKELSIDDSIILRDVNNNEDIMYNFKISNKKVVVSTGNDSYTIEDIDKANKLIATTIGDSIEYASVFILTTDGKIYSICLYDNNSNLITNIKNLEKTIKKYELQNQIRDFSSGIFTDKNSGNTTTGIYIVDIDDKQYILTAKKNKKISVK